MGFLPDRPWSPAPAVFWTSAWHSCSKLVLCQHLPPVPTVAVPNLHHSLLVLSSWAPSHALGKRSHQRALPISAPSPSSSTRVPTPFFQPSVRGRADHLLSTLVPLDSFSPFHLPHLFSSHFLPHTAPPLSFVIAHYFTSKSLF